MHSNIFSPLSLHENKEEGKPALKSKNSRAGMTYGVSLSHFWPRELSPLSITPEPLSCTSPMHRQQSFHWLPHRAHSAAGDFHFAPGREPHSFFMKMFHSSCLFPQIHSYPCAFPSFRDLLPLLGPAAQSWLCLIPCSPSPPSLCCHHSMARNF